MDTNTQIKRMFLNLSREQQLDMLNNSPNFGIFFALSKIALDAPISEGGIPTEDIRAIAMKLGYENPEVII